MEKILEIISNIKSSFIKNDDIQLVWIDNIEGDVSFSYKESTSDNRATNKLNSTEEKEQIVEEQIDEEQIDEIYKHITFSKEAERDCIKQTKDGNSRNGIYTIARYVYYKNPNRILGISYINNTENEVEFKNKRTKKGSTIFVDIADYEEFAEKFSALIRRYHKGEIFEFYQKDVPLIKTRFRHGFEMISADAINIEIMKVYTKSDRNGKQMAMGYLLNNKSEYTSITLYSYRYTNKIEEVKQEIRPGQSGILHDGLLEKFVRENGLEYLLKSGESINLGKAYLKYRKEDDEILLCIPDKNKSSLLSILVDCADNKYKVQDKEILKSNFGDEFEIVERDEQYKIIGKLTCKNKCLKYVLLSIDGNNKVITQVELLRICREGNIRNCRVVEDKSGKYKFVGIGMSFESLPTITEEEYSKIKWEMATKGEEKSTYKKAEIKAEGKVAVRNFMTNYYKEKLGITIESKEEFERKETLKNKQEPLKTKQEGLK